MEVPAQERSYTEALTGETVWTYHARLGFLRPDSEYLYEVVHDGAARIPGTFRTAPEGRSRPFRFTSFGDQSVPVPVPVGLGLGPHSRNAGYVVDAVEALDPLFHLLNGDLCYANVSDDPVATWSTYFSSNRRSMRNRPWMPVAGNHENEVGNGPHGYAAYLARFELPPNGTEFPGSWYAFTAGSVRLIGLQNDDVCLQDGGFSSYRRDHVPRYAERGLGAYVRGYSGGAQTRWLEAELASARESERIDWIVVFMHQTAMSSARFNGGDLGIRQHWLPLFDAYGVDLVLTGHEHHYERTFPVRGVVPGSDLLTPAPGAQDAHEVDPRDGTVHMVIGGGGNPDPTPVSRFAEPGHGVLITGVEPGGPGEARGTIRVVEPAPWSAYRDTERPYGFAVFDVTPRENAGTTSITVTQYGADAGSREYLPLDTFVLRKPLPIRTITADKLAAALRRR